MRPGWKPTLFKSPPTRRKIVLPAVSSWKYDQPAPLGYLTVHGTHASSNEYYTAQALDRVELPYVFQVSYLGGRRLSGGMVLDFLVLTDPLPTPLWVNGDYWHKGPQVVIDFYQRALLDMLLGGQMAQAVVLWGGDTDTPEHALASVKREFRI